jgi:DNA-binding transcriptional LysR family regulator
MMEETMAAPKPKLGAIDLNLLVVFDAIMQERSVTRAGRGVGLSQPAMSHALTRLRHMLKDELFVRSPKGMVPTPRAQQLALPIRQALDGLQHSLEPVQFDPSKAARTFHVAVDNYAAIVLVAPVAARIAKAAPDVTLEIRASGTLDVPDLLDRGQLELAISSSTEHQERFLRRLLLQDRFVAVLRKNHEAAATRELTVETFAALPHLEISSVLHATDFIDGALARRKLTRRIALRAPFLSAVRILALSDMVAVLPERIAEELIRYRPLVIRPLPHSSPRVEIGMVWPRWLDNQPAHAWLRDSIAGVAAKLAPPNA